MALMKALGLMSGTSLDGIDCALLETDGADIIHEGPASFFPYDDQERACLQQAMQTALAWNFKGPRPPLLKQAEALVTQAHERAVHDFTTRYPHQKPDLIGFHGQTVLHRPPARTDEKPDPSGGGVRDQKILTGQTLQLGDGEALSQALSLDLVYDFRTADMAAGGQGAPLVPVYHRALALRDNLSLPLVVLNLGGVANITYLVEDSTLKAGDVGPGNGLLDAWAEFCGLGPMDRDGQLALVGQADEAIVKTWLQAPFFRQPLPKSADRWDFGGVEKINMSPEDGAASLTAFTARAVSFALQDLSARLVLVGGGGRHNPALMSALRNVLGVKTLPVDAIGWRGDYLEAEAFAYLAVRHVKGLPLTFPETTGVSSPMRGGRFSSFLKKDP